MLRDVELATSHLFGPFWKLVVTVAVMLLLSSGGGSDGVDARVFFAVFGRDPGAVDLLFRYSFDNQKWSGR